MRVIGHRWSPHAHDVKDLLSRHRIAYRWLDLERDPSAAALAERAAPGAHDFPIVVFPDGAALVDPSARALVEKLGLETEAESRFYDLIIVGGGPAGLSAAVNGASEGLRTIVIEREVPGGQASQSARIENFLGFPDGLSGSDLARRASAQAERFGVEVLSAREARGVCAAGRYREVRLDDDSSLTCHSVLLAVGVSFRWLDAPGCPALVGRGVYYGAAIAEASAFRGQDVFTLGGGNSAGQAALLLAKYARHVIMIVLESSIDETMSAYLVERIRATPNITVREGTTVTGAAGDGHLERLTLHRTRTGEAEEVAAQGLFVFIGAQPATDWLESTIARDEQGFILAGEDVTSDGNRWPLERVPFPLETSLPGVFVAGDVRHGSVKRIATAVGEGAMAISFVHEYLEDR